MEPGNGLGGRVDGVGRGEEEKTDAPAGETVLDLRGRDEGDGENLQMVRERGNERGKNKMLRPIKKEEISQERRGRQGFYVNAIEDFLAQVQMVLERGNERGKNKMLRPIKEEEIPKGRRGNQGFYANAIEDFLAQESECCELMREGREKWDARNIKMGLWHAMKRIGTDVDIMVRGNRVFLKKKSKT